MSDAGQIPPQDLNAEQAALGACLIEPEAALLVISMLEPEDFYLEAHQHLYRAMQTVAKREDPVDLITVCAELRRTDDLDAAGGAEYLNTVIHSVPTAAHASRYAALVAGKAETRRAITLLHECLGGLYEQTLKPEELVGRVLPLVAHRHEETTSVRAAVGPYMTWMEQYLQEPPEPELPLIGIPVLDRKLGGLGREQVVVVKAEEKHGKTSLLRQSLLETARCFKDSGKVVLLYHLEGSMTSWLTGAVSYLGKLDRWNLRRGALHYQGDQDEAIWQQIVAALAELDGLPIRYAEHAGTLAEITADALIQQARCGGNVGAVYVDYLQLVQAPGNSKTESVMAASQGLVALHKRLGCPVITASQITRSEGGEKRTFFAHAIQMDASLVLQLDRGKLGEKNPDDARRSKQARIYNTHAREHDLVSTTELWFDGAHAEIRERTSTDHEQ